MRTSSGVKVRLPLRAVFRAMLGLAPILLAADLRAQIDAGLVGSTAAELEVMDLAGDSVQIPPEKQSGSTLRILVFWSTWSSASDHEFKILKERWPIWSKRGVSILAVNVEASVIGEEEREKVRSYVEDAKLPFPVALDASLKAFKSYGLVAVPTTIVVGNRGKILMRLSGFPVKASEQMLLGIEDRIRLEGEVVGMPMKESSLPHRRAVRLIQLARHLIPTEQWDMAEFSLQKAIRLDPKIVEARVALIRLYRDRKQEKLAEAVLREAKRTFPGDYRLMIEEAVWQYRHKNYKEAKKSIDLALQANPDHVPALVLLGKIEVALKQIDAALKAFELAMAKNPLSPDAALEAAKLQETLGKKTKALALFERAYRLLEAGLE